MTQVADTPSALDWVNVGDVPPRQLHDARLQVHHAAQVAVAATIAYLPHASDDSHTSLGWSRAHRGLVTHPIAGFRVVVLPATLSLAIADDQDQLTSSFDLSGRTVADAYDWLGTEVSHRGLNRSKLTPKKHYEIPAHLVASGGQFALGDGRAFVDLERWWMASEPILEHLVKTVRGASAVRCWPHHFDIATLISVAPSKTIGVGLSPGDEFYDEPYFYVGPYPYPPLDALPPLASGHWHTSPWLGAVLTGSEIVAHASAHDRYALVSGYIDSAIGACRSAMGV
jgi:hypothetical protein